MLKDSTIVFFWLICWIALLEVKMKHFNNKKFLKWAFVVLGGTATLELFTPNERNHVNFEFVWRKSIKSCIDPPGAKFLYLGASSWYCSVCWVTWQKKILGRPRVNPRFYFPKSNLGSTSGDPRFFSIKSFSKCCNMKMMHLSIEIPPRGDSFTFWTFIQHFNFH